MYSCFSVPMLEHYDQGDLLMKGFIGPYNSRGIRIHDGGS